MWKGIVIKEGLNDPRVLWETQELNVRVKNDNWHEHTVLCEKKTIEKIRLQLKPGFVAHFWNSGKKIVAFLEQTFEFEHSDSNSQKKAIDFGKQRGIPEQHLVFSTE